MEVTIVAAFVLLIVGKGSMIVQSGLKSVGNETAGMNLEDRAQVVIDRIAVAVMGSDRGTLLPSIEYIHATGVRYKFNHGVEDGQVVWSDVEEIELAGDSSNVRWTTRPDEADPLSVVWTRAVSELLEGEIPNGVDDNGNGLIDESRIVFTPDLVGAPAMTVPPSMSTFKPNSSKGS